MDDSRQIRERKMAHQQEVQNSVLNTHTRHDVYDDSQTDVSGRVSDSLDFSRGGAKQRLLIGGTLSFDSVLWPY